MSLPDGESTFTGFLESFEIKPSGWHRFHIKQAAQGGGLAQYAEKVETSQPDIINSAMALIGQWVTAQVNCFNSDTPNPHRPGTYYKNRYLNAIGPASQGAPMMQAQQPMQQQVAPPPGQPMMQQQAPPPQPMLPADPFAPDGRDLKIYRQVAWKTSVDLVTNGLLAHDPVAMVEAAEMAMGYLRYGPARFGVAGHDQPQAPPPQPQASDQFVPQGQQSFDQAPPPADDDIPF